MAFWVIGGGNPLGGVGDAVSSNSTSITALGHLAPHPHMGSDAGAGLGLGGKRRVLLAADAAASGCAPGCRGITKRPRLDEWGRVVGFHGHGGCPYDYNATARGFEADTSQERNSSIHVKNLSFLVIRERELSPSPTSISPLRPLSSVPPRIESHFHLPPLHYPDPHRPSSHGVVVDFGPSLPMERTQSGLSISSDTSAVQSCCNDPSDVPLLSDQAAANLVRRHVASIRHRHRDSQHGRILKSLINPKSRGADFPLDNDALRSIFSAANELFFANRLSQRVTWDWSHPASAQYESHIVGTTALRRCARLGGYETLIVLSSPILKDNKYNRRLLISTFLHEMIHSFLFIACGFKARQCGGHTDGFRQIAEVVDDWVGKESLRLRDMEADLERFIDEDDVLRDPMPTLNQPSLRHCSGDNKSSSSSSVRSSSDAYSCGQTGTKAFWRDSQSAWQRYAEAKDCPMIEAPHQPYQRYPGEWKWHDREGFRAMDLYDQASKFSLNE